MNLLASSVPQRALEKLGRVAVKFVFLIQKEALQVLFSSHKIQTARVIWVLPPTKVSNIEKKKAEWKRGEKRTK